MELRPSLLSSHRPLNLVVRRSMTPSIKQLAPPLRAILDAELAAGNSISEVAKWSPTCALFVLLGSPFRTGPHTGLDLEYRILNDPHYWKADYMYRNGEQCLACRL